MSKYLDKKDAGTGIDYKKKALDDYNTVIRNKNAANKAESNSGNKITAENYAATTAGGWEDLKNQFAPESQDDTGTEVTPVASISDAYLQSMYDVGNKIMNRDPFSYDLQADQLYQQYKDQYSRNGQLAMMDTMGQAAGLTGGYGSTYAQNAGQQAYQGYMNELNAIIPDLYNNAYNQYNNETEQLYNQYNAAKDLYSSAAGVESAAAQSEANAEQEAWDRQMELAKNNLTIDENGNIVKAGDGVEYSISNGYLLGSDGSVKVLDPNSATMQTAGNNNLTYDEESGTFINYDDIDGKSADYLDYLVKQLATDTKWNRDGRWSEMDTNEKVEFALKKIKGLTDKQKSYVVSLIQQTYGG